jgi:hypothetical protein
MHTKERKAQAVYPCPAEKMDSGILPLKAK